MADDGTVYVRYLIDDVDAAADFYVSQLGFEVVWSAGAAFAEIARGNLHLLLSGPSSSAARPMPDGRQPEPGGWNRIHLIVDDIASEVERLRATSLAARSCAAPAAPRSSSTIPRAIRSNCSRAASIPE